MSNEEIEVPAEVKQRVRRIWRTQIPPDGQEVIISHEHKLKTGIFAYLGEVEHKETVIKSFVSPAHVSLPGLEPTQQFRDLMDQNAHEILATIPVFVEGLYAKLVTDRSRRPVEVHFVFQVDDGEQIGPSVLMPISHVNFQTFADDLQEGFAEQYAKHKHSMADLLWAAANDETKGQQ